MVHVHSKPILSCSNLVAYAGLGYLILRSSCLQDRWNGAWVLQTTLVINWLKPLTDGESANNLPPFRVYLEFQRSRCITLHLTTVR